MVSAFLLICGILILFLIVFGGGFLVVIYNNLVKLKILVDEATADIQTFLKQRYDMIPNLVEVVKGYASHESSTFEAITKARSMAMQATSMDEKIQYENQLSSTLKSLFAVAENYPELKANTNFLDLQEKLANLEDNIQKSRRFYNGTVRDFNTKIQVFPTNLIAGMLGFTAHKFFEATQEEQENVKVKF